MLYKTFCYHFIKNKVCRFGKYFKSLYIFDAKNLDK